MSLDKVSFSMVQNLYKKLPQVALVTGTAWGMARYITRLHLNPMETLVFTAGTASIYHFTKPFFNKCDKKNPDHLYLNRGISLLFLAKVFKDALKLSTPLLKTAGMAYTLVVLLDVIQHINSAGGSSLSSRDDG